MTDCIAIDSGWIAANALPVHGGGTTKDSRGHVVVIGGGRSVPGAPRLTVEAALRVGAGKVQLATIGSAAVALGVAIPEAGIVPLAETEDGELADGMPDALAKALDRCDVAVIGPGISSSAAATQLLRATLAAAPSKSLVIDAAAIAAAPELKNELPAFAGALIFTPHYGEMAALLGWDAERIADDPIAAAREAVARHRGTVVLKGSETVIATPDGAWLRYGGGGVGLATGGSGDVLAGAIAGLLSRGAAPLVAAGWGVWLHGQAARRLAAEPGPLGFLARELPDQFPRLLPQ